MNGEGFQKTENGLWVVMLLLTGLACLKGIVGFQAHSDVLLAAAAQTLAGVGVLAAVIMRIRTMKALSTGASIRGLDKRIAIGSILLAVLIMVIGTQMGITSVKSLVYPVEHETHWVPLLVLMLSILAKEIMFAYITRMGHQLDTKEFIANVRRRRSDIYCSIVALIGLMAAMLGDSQGSTSFAYVDPLAGFIIALFIVNMGISVVKGNMSMLAENVLHQEDVADFVATVQRIHGVITVDHLSAREHGHYVVVEMTISVNPRLSVWEGHEVSKKIKQQLMKQYHHVSEVVIHVTPYDAGYPYKQHADVEANDLPSVLH